MKRNLLPAGGNWYKVNLHSHSLVSDGKMSVYDIKEAYLAHGYSAVAFTDHEILIPHNELTDENFVALNGLEYAISRAAKKNDKTCHFCAVALDPDNFTQPCWHRRKYFGAGKTRFFRVRAQFDESAPDYERSYKPEVISEMMKIARDAGFFVTYNHPVWSRETPEEYLAYEGMHAMEICNFTSRSMGSPEYCPMVYDEMLRAGKRIFCVATDDNHYLTRFGGFVMIRAPKLEYRALTSALVRGDFYASQGPLIEELTYEDGEIYARTSPARRILFTFGNQRFARGEQGNDEDKIVCEAKAVVPPDAVYVRLTVEDDRGRHANSSAYFLDELNSDKGE